MKLSFFGGASALTAACYLLELPGKEKQLRVLIDCGLFQSGRFVDQRNFKPFPFDPASLDVLLVTHAHIDHTGRIPKLVRDGFRGEIISTGATRDFAAIMLEDSLGVLTKEAGRHKEEVFYSLDDIERSLNLWQGVGYHENVSLSDSVSFRFLDAGHILGSSMIEFSIIKEIGTEKILFTGDVGNSPTPLLDDVEMVNGIHWMVIESVYGDRNHEDRKERRLILERIIEEAVEKGGVLMIPAFALERTQELLFELNELVEHNRVPRIPIFIDSPLAAKATAVYQKNPSYFNKSARKTIASGDDLFKFPGLKITNTVEESKSINNVPGPKIIVAGSGMSTGGRILHHERRYLSDPSSTLLLIGYQAKGSLGRQLLDGEKFVTIHSETIEVNAQIKQISGYSAHADQEALIDFVSNTRDSLKRVFAVQAEETVANIFRTLVRDRLGVDTVVPEYGQVFQLG